MDLKEQFELAEKFVEAHLKQCCVELEDYRNTSILIDGRVRELARMLKGVGNSLSLAQSMVTSRAISAVASQ